MDQVEAVSRGRALPALTVETGRETIGVRKMSGPGVGRARTRGPHAARIGRREGDRRDAGDAGQEWRPARFEKKECGARHESSFVASEKRRGRARCRVGIAGAREACRQGGRGSPGTTEVVVGRRCGGGVFRERSGRGRCIDEAAGRLRRARIEDGHLSPDHSSRTARTAHSGFCSESRRLVVQVASRSAPGTLRLSMPPREGRRRMRASESHSIFSERFRAPGAKRGFTLGVGRKDHPTGWCKRVAHRT